MPSADRHRPSVTIAGAGLAGALLATLLAQRKWRVDVFERRSDPRVQGYQGGRSINLALAERGLHALRDAGLNDRIMAQAVMMRGRMVHPLHGDVMLQRYGRDDSEVIWSIHRSTLNVSLLDAAAAAGARLHFNRRLDAVDMERSRAAYVDERTGEAFVDPFQLIVGADGAGSALRDALAQHVPLHPRFESLGHGYKELEIPPAEGGGYRLEPNALHIWPRGGYMCIALPNTEGTFTVTLFLPNDGDPGFSSLPDVASARAFFERDFADCLAHIPDFDADWVGHPVGQLGTLYLERWHLEGRAVLLGDAAHAMVPFHGQGMNCAFEDCVSLVHQLESFQDPAHAFAAFEGDRRPNAQAIQAMALENYVEMRDRVDDADYLLQRALERVLADRHPGHFVPRYSLVSFTRVPYVVAEERGRQQRALLASLTRGKTSIDEIDLLEADRRVLTEIPPL